MEIIKTVPENVSKTRLDKVCSEMFDDFSRSQLKKWILEGRILLNNEIALPKDLVNKNDEISLDPVSEDKISWQAEDISFDVIFENKDYTYYGQFKNNKYYGLGLVKYKNKYMLRSYKLYFL